MKFKDWLNEAGFAKFPPGWTRKSVIKFAKTLTKDTGKLPTEKGFFDECVNKMKKHFGEGAEGFCASVKDEAFNSTYWRGKGKTEKETKAAVAAHKKIPRKPKGKVSK